MRWRLLWIVPLLVVGPTLGADDKKDDTKPTPRQELQALQKEVQAAQKELIKNFRESKTDEEREKVLTQYRKAPQKFSARFLALAEKHADAKDVAYDALSPL